MESIINRYYDPATDEFMSIDPDVATTDQPYLFTGDDPLNGEDASGLCPDVVGIPGVSVHPFRLNPYTHSGVFVRPVEVAV